MFLEDYVHLAANLTLFAAVLLGWVALSGRRVAEARLPSIVLGLFAGTQAAALFYFAAIGNPGIITSRWAMVIVAVETTAIASLLVDRPTQRTSAHATALTLAFVAHSWALLHMPVAGTTTMGETPFLNIWAVFHLVFAAATLGACFLAAGGAVAWVARAASTRLKTSRQGEPATQSARLAQWGLRVAFALLTTSIFARGLWAYLGWGRYWTWDAQGFGLLILWLLLAINLHVPARSRWYDPARAVLVLFGLLVALVTVPPLGKSLITGL